MKTNNSANEAMEEMLERLVGKYTIGEDVYSEFNTMKGLALDTLIGPDIFQIQIVLTRDTNRFINQETKDDDYTRILLD